MEQRQLLHLSVGLLLIAGAIYGYQELRKAGPDLDVVPGHSEDMIAAVQYLDHGSKIVIIKNGEVTDVPGHVENSRDIDPVWRPDGWRLFFLSDREFKEPGESGRMIKALHIYRWNPSGGPPERKSLGKTSRSAPYFSTVADEVQNKEGIITSRGQVLLYKTIDGTTTQLLPPPSNSSSGTDPDGGVNSQFSALYSSFGSSFKKARFGKDKTSILAVMRRDEGEMLIIQSLVPNPKTGKLDPPAAVIAGDSIDFDVNPDGKAAVLVRQFRFVDPEHVDPQYVVKGRAKYPWMNALFEFDSSDLGSELHYLLTTDKLDQTLGEVVLSPDGTRLAFTAAKEEAGGNLIPNGLIVTPFPFTGDKEPVKVAEGAIREVSWDPDGKHIYYVKEEGGHRSIFSNLPLGSDEKRLTPETGDFGQPTASPQKSGS